jgi:trans-2,3-dihydro-3-hydroxyanthranilate isomerase
MSAHHVGRTSARQYSYPFYLVDVFAAAPLSGNSLSVFLPENELSADAMQRITQEMRQFESIFLWRVGNSNRFETRIFTMQEELDFAGHPIIGAAAVLHAEFWPAQSEVAVEFLIAGRVISVRATREGDARWAQMDQGVVLLMPPVADDRYAALVNALNLSVDDLVPGLPLQVLSTGLPYLIVPLRANLHQARIVDAEFEALLSGIGAKFVYVLDIEQREGRTWDNAGLVEDIATGSAAGPAGAYLVTHRLASRDAPILLRQGRFVGRPSMLEVTVRGDTELQVSVRGQVCAVGYGVLELPRNLE